MSCDQAHGQLLDEHFAAMRKEANEGVSDDEMDVDEEDEGGWDNWERDEASDSDDSSDGWENVSSDGDDLQISDSEDEERAKTKSGEPRVKTKTKRQWDRIEKLEKQGKGDKMEVDEEEKPAEDDDTKSVVSAAATDVSMATQKLSLLAQQKVSILGIPRSRY